MLHIFRLFSFVSSSHHFSIFCYTFFLLSRNLTLSVYCYRHSVFLAHLSSFSPCLACAHFISFHFSRSHFSRISRLSHSSYSWNIRRCGFDSLWCGLISFIPFYSHHPVATVKTSSVWFFLPFALNRGKRIEIATTTNERRFKKKGNSNDGTDPKEKLNKNNSH